MSECPRTKFSGYLGSNKTYALVCKYIWWPAMSTTTHQFCKSCDSCQRNKGNNSLPIGLLQPLHIPEYPCQYISMDLVTDLPTCCHHDSLVLVDLLTMLIVLTPCRKTVTAPQLAHLFIDDVFRRFGMPTSIVSDRNPRFTSNFWKSFTSLLGNELAMSSAYHPQRMARPSEPTGQLKRC
jgi:Integrase zinc binding domain